MKTTRRTEAGFVNSASLELLLAAVALAAIGVVMVGSWPVRFGVLAVAGALWLAVFIADRLTRFKPGDHVKVQFGPHAGASGRIIGLLPGGRGSACQRWQRTHRRFSRRLSVDPFEATGACPNDGLTHVRR